jgi:hypothetical protein
MRWIVRLGWLLLALALAAAAFVVAANAWLESTGGRSTLERQLTQRAGFPVRLLGEFDIMLFPALGVQGTELAIGGPGTGEAFVHAREYAVALELRPLLAGDLRVESIHLAHGALRPDRAPPSEHAVPGQAVEARRLPAIGAFTVSDFVVVGAGEPGYELAIDKFEVDGFEEGRETAFRLEASGFGRVVGSFRWDSADALLGLSGDWTGLLSDALAFSGELDFRSSGGNVSIRWPSGPADPDQVLGLAADFTLGPEAVRLDGVELSAGAQSVGGEGCLQLGAAPGLRLDLAADSLDLERLPELPSIVAAPASDNALDARLDIALRLRAGELRRAGALARNAVLSVGGDPDCSQWDRGGPEASG